MIPEFYLDEHYSLVIKDGVTMEDLVPKDVQAMAHQHWLSFPPSHPFVDDIVGIRDGILAEN